MPRQVASRADVRAYCHTPTPSVGPCDTPTPPSVPCDAPAPSVDVRAYCHTPAPAVAPCDTPPPAAAPAPSVDVRAYCDTPTPSVGPCDTPTPPSVPCAAPAPCADVRAYCHTPPPAAVPCAAPAPSVDVRAYCYTPTPSVGPCDTPTPPAAACATPAPPVDVRAYCHTPTPSIGPCDAPPPPRRIDLGELAVEVALKDIRNIHLSVHPPHGRVTVSAPLRMDMDTLRVFLLSKLGWIKQQQRKLQAQARETPREYLERESHYVWGQRYLLAVLEGDAAPSVELQARRLLLRVRPGADELRRRAIVEAWYRAQLKQAAAPLIAQWEPRLGVHAAGFSVQRMKTRWGSCNPGARRIRLNTELAKKPRECLEYIVVHELAHLLEPTHNARFVALLERVMPHWPFYREQLNRLPVSHEDWGY